MQAWELEAREAIRDLVARYNAYGDAGRFDEMMRLFAADAELRVEDRAYRGVAAIRGLFESAAAGADRDSDRGVRHFTATHLIDLESPTRAHGRAYFQVLTSRGLDHWGRYRDEYRRTEGAWRFHLRSVRLDGRVPGGWADRNLAGLREAP